MHQIWLIGQKKYLLTKCRRVFILFHMFSTLVSLLLRTTLSIPNSLTPKEVEKKLCQSLPMRGNYMIFVY